MQTKNKNFKPKKIKPKNIFLKLQIALKGFSVYDNFLDTGKVISVSDGVAKVSGLMGVRAGERVKLGEKMVDIFVGIFVILWEHFCPI